MSIPATTTQLATTIQNAMTSPALPVAPVQTGAAPGPLQAIVDLGNAGWDYLSASGQEAWHSYQADQEFHDAADAFMRGDLVGAFTNAVEGLQHTAHAHQHNLTSNQAAMQFGGAAQNLMNTTPAWMQTALAQNNVNAQTIGTNLQAANQFVMNTIT